MTARFVRQVQALALFRGVGAESLEAFLDSSRRLSLSANEVLLSPDVPNASLYAVLTGRLNVHLNAPGNEPLTAITAGGCVGEMSVIDETRPSAYVVAAEDTELLAFAIDTVWTMVNLSHQIARNLLLILAERLRFDNEYIIDSDELLRQYERNALTDPLTDLHNRHWLESAFLRKIQRSRIAGATLSLAMLDLDRFKEYNDTHGHLQGDRVLCQVATTLGKLFRPTDLIARCGGDEFAIVLPETNLATATEVAERVRAGVVAQLRKVGMEGVTVSGGVAQLQSSDDLTGLMERADAALYRAKVDGRNRICT